MFFSCSNLARHTLIIFQVVIWKSHSAALWLFIHSPKKDLFEFCQPEKMEKKGRERNGYIWSHKTISALLALLSFSPFIHFIICFHILLVCHVCFFVVFIACPIVFVFFAAKSKSTIEIYSCDFQIEVLLRLKRQVSDTQRIVFFKLKCYFLQ